MHTNSKDDPLYTISRKGHLRVNANVLLRSDKAKDVLSKAVNFMRKGENVIDASEKPVVVDEDFLPEQINLLSMLGFDYTMCRTGSNAWTFLYLGTKRSTRVPWQDKFRDCAKAEWAETFTDCFNLVLANAKLRDGYCYS